MTIMRVIIIQNKTKIIIYFIEKKWKIKYYKEKLDKIMGK